MVDKLQGKWSPEEPTPNLLASTVTFAFWCITCGIVVIYSKHDKHFRRSLKYLGYYFPPTILFVWAFDQRCLRLKAEEKLRRLEMILRDWPDVRIIAGIIDPEKQESTLSQIMSDVDSLEDHLLAQIFDYIRHYADEILISVGANGNYYRFRQVMEKVSLFGPDTHPITYKRLLGLLSDVFSMSPKQCFTRQIRRDMTSPLKNVIWRVDRQHLNRVMTIMEQIMADEEDEHYAPHQVLEMLFFLNWRDKRELCQIIFNESKRRASRFPHSFGLEFLRLLRQLEHRVFWLDIRSINDILEESIESGEDGLNNFRRIAYEELCSTVFSPLEDKEHVGTHSGRVFRRLKSEGSKVEVECILPDGNICTCRAESLSFRGLYSKKCLLKAGERMNAKIIPIMDIGQHSQQFTLKTTIAPLHPAEASGDIAGRGVFFEDGEETVVKELYEYISSHKE